jgi:hypothetical protein
MGNIFSSAKGTNNLFPLVVAFLAQSEKNYLKVVRTKDDKAQLFIYYYDNKGEIFSVDLLCVCSYDTIMEIYFWCYEQARKLGDNLRDFLCSADYMFE